MRRVLAALALLSAVSVGPAAADEQGPDAPFVLIAPSLERRAVSVVAVTPDGVFVRPLRQSGPESPQRTERPVTLRPWPTVAAIIAAGDTPSEDPTDGESTSPTRPSRSLAPPAAADTLIADSLARAARGGTGVVAELTSGERLIGRLSDAGASAGDDTITIDPISLPPLAVPIERIDRLVFTRASIARPRGTAQQADTSADDTVFLKNGDRRTGFVLSITDELTLETDDGDLAIPLRLIAEIDLASDLAPPPESIVWLRDGGVIAATPADPAASESSGADRASELIVMLGEGLNLTGNGDRTVTVSMDDLAAITHGPSRLRSLALASGPSPTTELARRGPLAQRVALSAGETAAFAFRPVSATDTAVPATFSATLRLSAPPPIATGRTERAATDPVRNVDARITHDSLGRGPRSSCVVVIALNANPDTPIQRVELTADRPVRELRIPLSPPPQGDAEIIVRVEPGPGGPIQDRVLIDGAAITPGPSPPAG